MILSPSIGVGLQDFLAKLATRVENYNPTTTQIGDVICEVVR
jgi:hypothetical protein